MGKTIDRVYILKKKGPRHTVIFNVGDPNEPIGNDTRMALVRIRNRFIGKYCQRT